MKRPAGSILLFFYLASCSSGQQKEDYRLVGGPCEGCEAIFEFDEKALDQVDTLPDFNDRGTRIKVTGTIYRKDGVTPAEGVILYIYHTDQNGVYATRGGEKGWARRHGFIRGWIKTGTNGEYAFYTLKPGVYPDRSQPAHVHPVILEPDGRYYWLGSYYFAGDPLLTQREVNPERPRGGSPGILTLKEAEGILIGTRDIVLGKNIPDYK